MKASCWNMQFKINVLLIVSQKGRQVEIKLYCSVNFSILRFMVVCSDIQD